MKMTREARINLLVLSFFILLSIIMLWPLPLHMADAFVSHVDPLLNTWIFDWDTYQLFRDPFQLFDANIFFPLKNTLAFSEHMIVLSLIAFPVSLVSGNPILGYNFIQLLAYILCGFAVYLLVYHLTKSRIAGIIAGIIFAFSPYRFRQVGHIQNLTVFWTPLSLLYLHKAIKKPSWKYVLLFALFFVLQALSCGYLGVFLAIAVGIFVLYYLLFMPRANIAPFFKKLVIAAILSSLIIIPFLVPYLQVKKEHKFERTVGSNIQFSANILGYATISRFNKNVFYEDKSVQNRILINKSKPGRLRPIGRGLFPGILTILLATMAFLIPPYASRFPSGIRSIEKTVNYLLLTVVGLTGIIIGTKGFVFSVAGINISLTHLRNPLYLIIFLFIVKLALIRFTLCNFDEEKNCASIHLNFYLFLGVFACILTLGPKIFYITHDFGTGPYMLLYKNIVLFKGIRVPERFGILVMLALSVLAGYGVIKVLALLKTRGKAILSCFIIAFLVYEFIPVPLPYEKLSREPAEVYKWLASSKEKFAILEFPLIELQTNKYYMYWSIVHRKNLANGSSGFNPPIFNQLRTIAHEMGPFPHQEFIHYVKTQVPVKYLILHLQNFSDTDKEEILKNVSKFPEDLKLVEVFEQDDYVYEVIY
ncbi:MAG: glycosyltransferase family 39 protein [Candidatus Aminicenantes bacterium]|nr:MAG: glycosyltransferase family 39 protein [Candidatus Aminicenantes bacterium]